MVIGLADVELLVELYIDESNLVSLFAKLLKSIELLRDNWANVFWLVSVDREPTKMVEIRPVSR